MNYKQDGWDNYEFRCHSYGKLMTKAKGKSFKQQLEEARASYDEKMDKYRNTANKETKTANALLDSCNKLNAKIKELEPKKDTPHLSTTAITYLSELYVSEVYKRTRDVKIKYFEKGLKCEEKSIDLVSLHTGKFLIKNSERKSNGFLTGEMDVNFSDGILVDVKSSWDIWSFTTAKNSPEVITNIWQMKGYLWLWEKKEGHVVHTLVDTPEELIEQECKSLLFGFIGTKDDYEEACKEIRMLHSFEDIPAEERIFTTKVVHDDNDIDRIKSKIIEAREYLNQMSLGNVIIGEEEDYD